MRALISIAFCCLLAGSAMAQRGGHAGGGMAVRTITCLPAIIGAWRHVGGGALLLGGLWMRSV